MTQGDSTTEAAQRTVALPGKVIVSLRAGFVLALANVVCVAILAWAYLHVKNAAADISVTGSAKKTIRSDLVVWKAKISVNRTDLAQGYEALKESSDRTMTYLRDTGRMPADQISLSAIDMQKNYARDDNGNSTDKVTSYDLSRTVQITSTDVDKITLLASQVTELIKDGVILESEAPGYIYTKLADLKIEMLAEATRDATQRAEQIAQNSGATLGKLREARMGVLQINPIHSTSVSSYGNSDTSSLDKDIIAVVSARFELR